MKKRRIFVCAVVATFAALQSFGEAGEGEEFDRWSVGLSGSIFMPQGGSRMHRVGGAAARIGYYLSENVALEGDVSWLEDVAGLGLQALGHWQGWSLYGDLFGYSRFDPFFTIGARGWIGRSCGQVGPKLGIGSFYHLTDNWALRGDADATLGLDTDVEVGYTLSVGVQYSF